MTPDRWETPVRVYYEDTDLAGVVYHANYLRYIERARSDALRAAGVDQTALKARGLVFVVRSMEADWRAPARFDDALVATARIAALRGASVDMEQQVERAGEALFSAKVRLALMDERGRPARLPADLKAALGAIATAGAARK